MNKQEKVSIIVPLYNVEKYVEQCLKTLINQSYNNYEIILIDDGSTDDTLKICEKFKSNSKIKLLTQKNQGVSKTRNRGIIESNGKYVMFVDSDDLVDRDYVKDLVECLEKNDVDVAICDYTYEENAIGKRTEGDDYETKTMDVYNDIIMSQLKNGYVWNKIFKIDVVKENNIFFPENITVWEDMYFLLKYLKSTENAYILHKNLYYYRERENSVIRTNETIKKSEDKLSILNKIISENNFKEDYLMEIEKIYAKTLLRYLIICKRQRKIISKQEKKYYLDKVSELKKKNHIKFNIKEKIKFYYLKLENIF